MSFTETELGLIVPTSAVQRKGTPPNRFISMPHAKDFAPGRSKHYSDVHVGALNKDLQSLNAGIQKLFAVWTNCDQPRCLDGSFGVSIWVTEDNGETGQCLGNPATQRTADGLMGVPDKGKIFEWLAAVNCLSEDNRVGAKKIADYFTGNNERVAAANESIQLERRAIKIEKQMEKITEKEPSRSDRTIAQPQKKTSKKE